MLADAAYSKAAVWLRFIRPIPPILTGSANSSRSAPVQLKGRVQERPRDFLAIFESAKK